MPTLRIAALTAVFAVALGAGMAGAPTPASASCQRLCEVRMVKVCKKFAGIKVSCRHEERQKCRMSC